MTTAAERANGRPGKGRSGPGIAGGNHEVMEIACRRMAPGQLDPRFQVPRPEKTPNVPMVTAPCPPKKKHERKRPLLWVTLLRWFVVPKFRNYPTTSH